jgi:hypothetical protein
VQPFAPNRTFQRQEHPVVVSVVVVVVVVVVLVVVELL